MASYTLAEEVEVFIQTFSSFLPCQRTLLPVQSGRTDDNGDSYDVPGGDDLLTSLHYALIIMSSSASIFPIHNYFR